MKFHRAKRNAMQLKMDLVSVHHDIIFCVKDICVGFYNAYLL